jgi:hypothetical protein
MKKSNFITEIILLQFFFIFLIGQNIFAAPERPSDSDLMAFKVYHHTVYKETTTKQVGGTNKLLHTTELPTEGTDPVVTPALDHLYTKAVLDLTEGPVVVELPEVKKERFFPFKLWTRNTTPFTMKSNLPGNMCLCVRGKT